MKKEINESMRLEEEWFKEAEKQTPDTLIEFINHMMNDYHHDYGTVCHAIAACAIAAAHAANNAGGGITGFQAGFVMWDFIRQWMYIGNKCGMRLVNYDDMLYPQYEGKFAKTITKDTWQAMQKQAREKLKDCSHCAYEVVSHWEKIAEGIVPFGYIVIDR